MLGHRLGWRCWSWEARRGGRCRGWRAARATSLSRSRWTRARAPCAEGVLLLLGGARDGDGAEEVIAGGEAEGVTPGGITNAVCTVDLATGAGPGTYCTPRHRHAISAGLLPATSSEPIMSPCFLS